MVTTTRTKEQGWALASVFMCKASTTHTACERKRCKGDANTVRDNYSRGRSRGFNFQMKSGSAAPKWVSEEEPPQRSLTPLPCRAASCCLFAPVLLSRKTSKVHCILTMPPTAILSNLHYHGTHKAIQREIERWQTTLLLAWLRALPDLHEVEKERIWEFLWISQACNLKKVLHFCTENDGAEKKKKYSANSTSGLHYWSEDKFCHRAINM